MYVPIFAASFTLSSLMLTNSFWILTASNRWALLGYWKGLYYHLLEISTIFLISVFSALQLFQHLAIFLSLTRQTFFDGIQPDRYAGFSLLMHLKRWWVWIYIGTLVSYSVICPVSMVLHAIHNFSFRFLWYLLWNMWGLAIILFTFLRLSLRRRRHFSVESCEINIELDQ